MADKKKLLSISNVIKECLDMKESMIAQKKYFSVSDRYPNLGQ